MRQRNLRPTRKKIAILQAIIDHNAPFSTQQLHRRVTAKTAVDLVTVYRALTCFRGAGVVREIGSENGVRYYELACCHNPAHLHFRCEKCNRIECLDTLREKDRKYLSHFAGAGEVREISIILSGLCPSCRRNET
ncbi:MAG: transcriptional repressor [Candidatus Latescibacteria bacterium]|nr:transcriptional repressor [Candidatus Latescibacterota bacterium]